MRKRDETHVHLGRTAIIAAIGEVNFDGLNPKYLSTGLDKEHNVMLNFTTFPTGHKIRITLLHRKQKFNLSISQAAFEDLTEVELRGKISEITGLIFL